MRRSCKFAVLLLAAGAALPAAAQAQIFTQNFSSNANGFSGGTLAVTPSGERYLELANSAQSVFTYNTAGLTGLSVSFNLYGIQSVDGNGPDGGGPDNFYIYLNGAASPTYTINLANYNSGSNSQNFNGNLAQSGPGYSYAPFTGATAVGTLGYGTGPFGDSTYTLNFALPDAATTTIRFVGATNETASASDGSLGGNEAYGIDNFSLAGQRLAGAVPEPATWGMMILGFGAMGAAMRRRIAARARFATA